MSLLAVGCEHEAVAAREGPSVSPTADGGRSAVLVELYTSQGCSSCPPADALLRSLYDERPDDVTIVPLAFHVDYWDRLGWPDPFADARWTERQSVWSEVTGSRTIYTPQLLFDGEDHRVGTTRSRARAALRTASAEPPAMELALATEREGSRLRVTVEPRWRVDAPREPVAIMIAVTDGGHRTDVRRGENAGRTLAADFVVRDMDRACVLEAGAPASTCEGVLALGPVSRPGAMRVVAFAQGPSRKILGVATTSGPGDAS